MLTGPVGMPDMDPQQNWCSARSIIDARFILMPVSSCHHAALSQDRATGYKIYALPGGPAATHVPH